MLIGDWMSYVCSTDLGDTQQFAPADLARRLDHQRVLAGRGRAQLRARKGYLVRAGRARRAGDAVRGEGHRAARGAPPLAHVAKPLGAFVRLHVVVVPEDRKSTRMNSSH